MGFGNLINQNILAGKKLKKVHQDDRKETKSKTEEASASTSEPPSKSSFGKTKAPMVRFSICLRAGQVWIELGCVNCSSVKIDLKAFQLS